MEWKRLMNDKGQYYYLHIPSDRIQYEPPTRVEFDRYGEQIPSSASTSETSSMSDSSGSAVSESSLKAPPQSLPSYSAVIGGKHSTSESARSTNNRPPPPAYHGPYSAMAASGQQQQGYYNSYDNPNAQSSKTAGLDTRFSLMLNPTVLPPTKAKREVEQRQETRELYLSPTITNVSQFPLTREGAEASLQPIQGGNPQHAVNFLQSQWLYAIAAFVTQFLFIFTICIITTNDEDSNLYHNLSIVTPIFTLIFLILLFYFRCGDARGLGPYVYANGYFADGKLLSNRFRMGWDYLTCFIYRNAKYSSLRDIEAKVDQLDDATPQLYIAIKGTRTINIAIQSEQLAKDYSNILPPPGARPPAEGILTSQSLYSKERLPTLSGLATTFFRPEEHHMNTDSFCHMYPVDIQAFSNVSTPSNEIRDYFFHSSKDAINPDVYLEYRYGYIVSPQDYNWLQQTQHGLVEWHRQHKKFNPEGLYHITSELVYVLQDVTQRNTDGEYGMDQFNLHSPFYSYGINNYYGCPNAYVWHHGSTKPMNYLSSYDDLDTHAGSIPEFTSIISPIGDSYTTMTAIDAEVPAAPRSTCCCIFFNPITFWLSAVLGFLTGADIFYGFWVRLFGGGRRFVNFVHKKQLHISRKVVIPNGYTFDKDSQVSNNNGKPIANVVTETPSITVQSISSSTSPSGVPTETQPFLY